MEICSLCGRCDAAPSCLETRIRIDGVFYRPRPWQPRKKTVFEEDGIPSRCPCCGVLPTGFHHVGCFLEICPRCEGHWLSCRCFGIKVPVNNKEECRVIAFPGTATVSLFPGGGQR
ncbi:hypothetical protein [Desulfobotulus sp.]|uniref:hypothetical protein n=1 Tax=Desulfobotulus sp. TaxID=1940337 RepID=UPI002A3601FD|nr:hypothetical protein [Desulfobotulus sp.]MDY0161620.1 hypothetical protein [Desulfobotulus sp.]